MSFSRPRDSMAGAPVARPAPLHIVFAVHDGSIVDARIALQRPAIARRLVLGQCYDQVPARLALVYHVCANAHRAAAHHACAAALGENPSTSDQTWAVLRECAFEHVWRWWIEWPKALQKEPDFASMRTLRACQAEDFCPTLARLMETTLLREPPAVWLKKDLAALLAWAERTDTVPASWLRQHLKQHMLENEDPGATNAPFLPSVAAWNEHLAHTLALRMCDESTFCLYPHWQGTPRQTGTLARCASHPIMTAWRQRFGSGIGARVLARLVELALIATSPQRVAAAMVRAFTVASGVGLALVETARGVLCHLAQLDRDGVVADYAVLAPTEWNFHPQGVLTTASRSATLSPALGPWLVRSLDPCVAFTLEYQNA